MNKTVLLVCGECAESCSEDDALDDKLYECNECSGKFLGSDGGGRSGNMCPECGNKFGTRIDSKAGTKETVKLCPSCNEGELEEQDAWECIFCGEAIEADDEKLQYHYLNEHADEIVEDWLAVEMAK